MIPKFQVPTYLLGKSYLSKVVLRDSLAFFTYTVPVGYRLVPMKVHEASSLYSEEKAKILRSVGSKIEEKDQHLNMYLASLKLEHMNLWDPDVQTTEWERLPLPDELVERCAALNAKQQVIQDLVDIMGKLSDTSQDVEKVLKEIKKLILAEELKLASNYSIADFDLSGD